MASNHSQVFQTENPSRWKKFLWSTRIILFCFGIVLWFLVIALRSTGLNNPEISLDTRAMKKVLTGPIPAYRESDLGKKYRGMRRFIKDRWANGNGFGQHAQSNTESDSGLFADSVGIRAGFYVAWDAQSFFSLQRNISKLNLVLPEWFFLDENADTLQVKIDPKALKLIQAAGVKVMPMLTNNIKEMWRGDVVHRIVNDKAKREKLISDLVKALKANHFAGINIDFEELIETHNEVLTNFQKELSTTLHNNHLLVTQDVSPFNDDYDYTALANSNDYLFLMAYDQSHPGSEPGAISSQRWIEAAVDLVARHVPSKKIVLGIAAYGYDWGGENTETLTYQKTLSTARESEGRIQFNDDTYNLSFDYYDSNDTLHHVYFTDAATTFNTLRFATEYGLAGTALWRLGSEDMRIWSFYNKPMNKSDLLKFDFKGFSGVRGNSDVDYTGDGEILDVLSTPSDGKIVPEVDRDEMLISGEKYVKLPSVYVGKKIWKKYPEKTGAYF